MGRFNVIQFFVSSYYDERELETLLETMEIRGAEYRQLQGNPGWFKVWVPEAFDLDPYYRTLLDCDSVGRVQKLPKIHHAIPIAPED